MRIRSKTIVLLSLIVLASLVGLLALVLSRDAKHQESIKREYQGSRFDTLTSDVWRYGKPFQPRDLQPVPNNNPNPEPQPPRDRPERLTLSADGTRLYVTLAGTEAEPGNEVAVVDLRTGAVKKIPVGLRPYGPYLHPGGRFLVVTCELSNYASVIDTQSDQTVGKIPLDFYCQGLAFSKDGRKAWVANRYLDQVLVVELEEMNDHLTGKIAVVGGFDEKEFFGRNELAESTQQKMMARGHSLEEFRLAVKGGVGGINGILRARCSRCHNFSAGGFLAGDNQVENFLSAVQNSVSGRPEESSLLRAVIPQSAGGFGDQKVTPEYHPGGALFEVGEPDLKRIEDWIRKAEGGPGIPVGNPGSHPKDLVLSPNQRHLFVGNTATMDMSVVDVEANREVTAVYFQSLVNGLAVVTDPNSDRDLLVALSLGAGFGAPRARDPLGAETWDRSHPAAQLSVLRDPKTTDPYPPEVQAVLGPFDAVDGTSNFKMRDIQNDLIAIDISRLSIPKSTPGAKLDYLLKVNRYEAHPGWVRYTSDTAEALSGDQKGDIAPELQRVQGSFPEGIATDGDRLFVTMAGTFELVEWKVQASATDPAERLVPLRVWETGLRPMGVAVGRAETPSEGKLYVANQLVESVSVIDRNSGDRKDIVVGNLSRPPFDTDAEKGELVVHSSVFTSDGDTSCLHCHVRDTGDGRGWGAAETVGQDHEGYQTPGGTLGIPQMRNIYAIQPYYFEGTHRLSEGQGADIAEPAASTDFDRPIWAGDYTSVSHPLPKSQMHLMHDDIKERVTVGKLDPVLWHDLEERRDEFLREQSLRYFGRAATLNDASRYTAAWLGNTNHLLPNPFDPKHPSVVRGERIFNDSKVMCAVCHTPGEFTNKSFDLAPNDRRALPVLTTMTRRDASYSLASVRAVQTANGQLVDMEIDDKGRVENKEGTFTTMQLRGIFDRPPVFLHHGRARSLREVLCTPGHSALRSYRLPVLQGLEDVRPGNKEIGLNEFTARTPSGPLDPRDQILDTHGGTSHLTPRQIEDLVNFLKSIE